MARPTLRKYLAYRFFVSIVGAFVLCSVLIFMIDFIEVLRQSGKYGDIGLARVLRLTALRLPAYTELLITFAVLVGTITTLLQLNRKSELAVMRSGGMSVWQFLAPGLAVAVVLGVFGVTVYNPLAAAARERAEQLHAQWFGREANFLSQTGGSSWLRQDSVDGSSALHGAAVSNGGLTLTTVTAFRFNKDGALAERISGQEAHLREGYWEIVEAWVVRPGQPPQQYETYQLATYLSP